MSRHRGGTEYCEECHDGKIPEHDDSIVLALLKKGA